MAWNFCAYCGMDVNWPPVLPAARLATSQRCSGCGRELYRNPDVHLLCLTYEDSSGPISRAESQLYHQETIQEALQRLLRQGRFAATRSTGPRLFAIITDLDSNRVYLVFRARVLKPLVNDPPDTLRPWVIDLEARLRAVLKGDDHGVHSGTVQNGRLELIEQISE